MAYKTPTSRKNLMKRRESINLIPILDAVFIFIFFLLMSTQFVKIFEISSDVPIVSDQEPPKTDKKPLALTVTVKNTRIEISTGMPGVVRKVINKTNDGLYDLDSLHSYIVSLKQSNLTEESAILEPIADISYEEIVNIMDAIRKIRNTDEPIFKKDKDGTDVQVKSLFNKIIFGNIMS